MTPDHNDDSEPASPDQASSDADQGDSDRKGAREDHALELSRADARESAATRARMIAFGREEISLDILNHTRRIHAEARLMWILLRRIDSGELSCACETLSLAPPTHYPPNMHRPSCDWRAVAALLQRIGGTES